jgi:GNAT superfamily N-acetyltransferase
MWIAHRPYDHPDTQQLVERINAYYVDIYGGRDRDPTDAEQFVPPAGLFLVGYLDGVPVACGGWRRRPDATVEIKRMYVADEARGRGLARAMLAELERTAAGAGAQRIVLNTGYRQGEAMALYQSSGYVRTDERFGVYGPIEGAHFFTKDLQTEAGLQ